MLYLHRRLQYGPTSDDPSPHWYTLPDSQVQVSNGGATWTISITDGGLGDDDLAANGVIFDQGGPGGSPGNPGGGSFAIPVLPAPLIAMLALLLGVIGWRFGRR